MRELLLGIVAASLTGCGFSASGQSDPSSDAPRDDASRVPDSNTLDAATDAPTDSAPDAIQKACPDGGTGFHGQTLADAHFAISDHFFYFSGVGDVKHFNAAETACEALGSAATKPVHLATPSSTEAAMVGAVQPSSYMWIGVYQLQDQASPTAGWVTVTGKTGADVYTDWAMGEPSDGGGGENNGENYVEMYGATDGHPDGTMNDTSANDNLGYICGCDGDAAVP
ncbi:MAG TPA: C-type lectin domain-containing protein [Kofleriaceae bacterium]|jgi:hypothetical protein